MSNKKQFPNWLHRTEAEIEEEARTQEQRRAGYSRANLTREEELISRGELLERTSRGNLDAIQKDKEFWGEGITLQGHAQTRAEELTIQEQEELERLAQSLSMQGRHEEAAGHSAEQKKYYQGIVAAIEMDDSEKCDCEDTVGKIGEQDIAITPRFAAREVFSLTHQKIVSLVTCNKCGHENARAPKARILLSQSAMNNNRAVVQSGTARGLISDVDLLKV